MDIAAANMQCSISCIAFSKSTVIEKIYYDYVGVFILNIFYYNFITALVIRELWQAVRLIGGEIIRLSRRFSILAWTFFMIRIMIKL